MRIESVGSKTRWSTFAACLLVAFVAGHSNGTGAGGAPTETELRRALATAEATSGVDSVAVADALDRLLAEALESDTAPGAECQAWAERAISIRERTAGASSLEFCQALVNAAKLEFKAGRYADAESRFARAANSCEAAEGSEGVTLASVLNDRGLCLQMLARFDEATPLYLRALAIRSKRLGENHPETAGSVNNLAALARHRGEYARAIELYGQALASYEQAEGRDGARVATVLNNIALCQQFLGDYDAAELALRRSLAIREQRFGPQHTSVATALTNLASVLDDMARYADARPLFERALTITETQQGANHPRMSAMLNTYAVMLRHMGALEEAKQTYQRALTIAEATGGASSLEAARVRYNLAVLLQEQGQHLEAIALLTQVRTAQEKALGPDHPDLGNTLQALGVSQRELGDLTAARALLQRALQIREQKLGAEHPLTAATLSELAKLHERIGELPETERLLKRALEIRRRDLGEGHPLVAATWQRLALFHAQHDNLERALDEALRAETIGRKHFKLTIESLAEERALLWMQARPSAIDLLLSIATHRSTTAFAPVWNAVLQSRGAVFEELSARRRALAGSNAAQAQRLRRELQSTTTRVSRLLVRGPEGMPVDRYSAIVSAANAARDAAEEALANATLAYRQKRERERVDLAVIGDALPAGSVLVAFVEYNDVIAASPVRRYAALTLRAKGTPRWHPLDSAGAIDAKISNWRREAGVPPGDDRAAEQRYRVAGTELRRVIWDPLADDLAGASLLLFVPAGNLHLVNFATLPREQGGYLLDSGVLMHYLATEHDVLNTLTASASRGLLALGGVDYDGPAADRLATARNVASDAAPATGTPAPVSRELPQPCRNFASIRFPPLPGARLEVEDLAALWRRLGHDDRPPVMLTGNAGGEADFKRLAPGKRFVHLATHGYFLKGACDVLPRARGVGELVADDEPVANGRADEWIPPSVGLALAGANRRAQHSDALEDGIITAEELSALDFGAAEWVVLSACNSGLGDQLGGEGVLGLRRALQIAGARSVIMSLWPVEDDQTRRWMSALYRAHLAERKSTAASTASAATAVLNARRAKHLDTHPFHWGAFVAGGDWR